MATTSEYGYITVANLEDYASTDYSGMDAIFTDIDIEMSISTAERMINAWRGGSETTATDGMVAGTLLLSAWLMNQKIESLGYGAEGNPASEFTFTQIVAIVKDFLKGDTDVGIDMIPMSGADRLYTRYGQ